MMGDNPTVDEATGAVYVTGHPNLLKYLQHAENTNLPAPTVIVKMTVNQGQDRFYGKRVCFRNALKRIV